MRTTQPICEDMRNFRETALTRGGAPIRCLVFPNTDCTDFTDVGCFKEYVNLFVFFEHGFNGFN